MTHITDHVDQAVKRLITQYRGDRALVDPLTLGPTAGFATHRFPSMASTYILKVRRINAADEVDVWDFQQNTSNYKLTPGGGWIDGSGETFYVTYWYDQTGNGNDIEQSTESNQPGLLLNVHNGWPILNFDGINDSLANIAGKTLENYIAADNGTLISYNAFSGTPKANDVIFNLPGIIGDVGTGYLNIMRGIFPTGGDDRIWFYHWDGDEDYVGAAYITDRWYVLGWEHHGNVLRGYIDGVDVGETPSGNTDVDLTLIGFALARTWGGRANANQEMALTFNKALTTANHYNVNRYCRRHR